MEPVFPCPLVNTARLKPFRQRLNRVIMTILDSGEVSMELMGHVNHSEVTKELFHVSADGTQIQIYQSSDGIASLNGCPVPGQVNKIYTYPNLPAKHWKKYQHVYKFVELVKSRTPKVMLVTEKAKCSLMENNPQPDFQACFYGGVKMLFSKSKIHITEADGSVISFDSEGINTHVDNSTKEMFSFAQKCQNQCLLLEKSVNGLHLQDPTCDLFPITVGTNSRPFHFPMSDQENKNSDGSKLSLELPAVSSSSSYESQTTNHLLQTPLHPLSEGNGLFRTSESCDNLASTNFLLDECNSHVNQDDCVVLLQTHLHGNQLESCNLQLQKLNIQGNGAFCSESQMDQMLQAKLCQFAEYSSSSQNSSFTSQSTINTPQKAAVALAQGCYYTSSPSFGSHIQCGQAHNSQFCQRQEIDLTNFVGAGAELLADNSYSIDKDFVNHEGRPSDSHLHKLTSNCHTDTAFTYNSNSEADVSHAVTTQKLYHTTPPINYNAPINREYETLHSVDSVNEGTSSPSYLQSDDFLTPKKSQPPRSLVKCYSVDSKLHQHIKHGWHNSSLNISDLGNQKENVKRNLFHDNALIEPLVSPFKVATYQTLSDDILAFRPNPSLELSDCSESEDKSSHCQILKQYGPQATQNSKCVQNSCNMKYETSSNIQENDEEYLNNDPGVWMMSTPAHSCIDIVGQPFHADESLVQSTDTNSQNTTSGNDSGLPSSEDPDSCNSGCSPYNSLQVKKSGTLNPAGTQDVKVCTKECFSPRKQNLMRKIAPISPEKKVSDPNSKQRDDMRNSAQDLKELVDVVQRSGCTRNSDRMLETSAHSETKIPSANSSTCKVHSFSTSKTDCSSSSRAAAACLSPQKEFVMPSGMKCEQARPEQALPAYMRNSLDMSCSSVYSDCSSPSSGCDPIRQVFVPYTGWASFYATGAVWILYNDGTQLGVKSNEATMTYIDQDGTQQKYRNNDVVPEIVKLKLEKLPAVLNLLMKSQASAESSN